MGARTHKTRKVSGARSSGDVSYFDAEFVKAYDDVLAPIERALGET